MVVSGPGAVKRWTERTESLVCALFDKDGVEVVVLR